MKILVLASTYPYTGNTSAGIYNERSVRALREHCEVEVLVPRPLSAPILSSLNPRWKNYASMVKQEVREGVSVYRPAYLQIPHLTPAFWLDPGTYIWCARQARRMHWRAGFDAILGFGLVAVGNLAWRLGRDLGVPAVGWATGSDVRAPGSKAHSQLVSRALDRLDLVFYQSQEMRGCAAGLLRVPVDQLGRDQHVVLPRGIPDPPTLQVAETRRRMRKRWNLDGDQTLVLYVGRIVRGKGVFDLLEAMRSAALRQPNMTCMLVGSVPGFDDTPAVQEKLDRDAFLRERVRVLPACDPKEVWEWLCAADIFAFPSFGEGMPNSLLEAMVMGVASVAYAIPPVLELEGGSGGLVLVPTGNTKQFAEALLRLSVHPEERARLGNNGEARVTQQFMVRRNILEAVRRIESLVQKSPNLRFGEDLSATSTH